MSLGSDIVVDDDVPVSPVLLSNLDRLQQMFCLWEKQLGKQLHRVEILGGDRSRAETRSDTGAMAFFSAAVDGSYTFIKRRDEVDFLVFAKGIDMQLSNESLFDEAFARNQAFLAQHRKPLIACDTNVRFLDHEYGLGWGLCSGGGLSSMALASGATACFVASTVTYAATEQEGSNYITDHLWSNEQTQILHDGAEANRLQKIEAIADFPKALDILRVCWQDKQYNCGQCEKCLRTMTELRLLNIEVPTLPPLTDELVRKRLARTRVYSARDFSFVEESLERACQVQDRHVVEALSRVRRSYLFRNHVRGLLSAFDKPVA